MLIVYCVLQSCGYGIEVEPFLIIIIIIIINYY